MHNTEAEFMNEQLEKIANSLESIAKTLSALDFHNALAQLEITLRSHEK